jgi:hypothetical protein
VQICVSRVDPQTVTLAIGDYRLASGEDGDVFALPQRPEEPAGVESLFRLSKPSPGRLRIRSFFGNYLAVSNGRIATIGAPSDAANFAKRRFPLPAYLHLAPQYVCATRIGLRLLSPPLDDDFVWMLHKVGMGHYTLFSKGAQAFLAATLDDAGLELLPDADPRRSVFHVMRSSSEGGSTIKAPSGRFLSASRGSLTLGTEYPVEVLWI